MVWYSHLFRNFPQFVVTHTVIVSEAEVNAFLEFPCFFCDPMDVGNMISVSSPFSKSSLCISASIMFKPSLKDFEHYLASVWNEHNTSVV